MYLYSLGLPEDAPQFDLLFQSRPLSPQNPRVSLALYHSARLRLFGVRLPRSLDPRPRALVVRPIGARAGIGVTRCWTGGRSTKRKRQEEDPHKQDRRLRNIQRVEHVASDAVAICVFT